ncbi:MAG: hypothetical protein P8Z30_04660 [Acidobacteriota bacterium]
MPRIEESFKLSPKLQHFHSSVLNIFDGHLPQLESSKIIPMYSRGVLEKEKLLNNRVLVGFSQRVASDLNNAKSLMQRLGIKDVTKAPAIKVNQSSLRVVPGHLKEISRRWFLPLFLHGIHPATGRAGTAQPFHPLSGSAPGFSPVSWLVDEAVIIASKLDLTHTHLIIEPSVKKLTIIVETLTCGAGAQISYDDRTVWHPTHLPQTTARNGNSYNRSNHPHGSDNGPSGGNGASGQAGRPQTIRPPAAPSVSIYALNITGMPAINIQGLKGGPGNPGQNGGKGGDGAKGINGSDVALFGVGYCHRTPGKGGNGGHGGNGGNGGNGGQGGDGGSFLIATTQTNWQALLNESWHIADTGGPGGDPGSPGSGGAGGAGGDAGDPSPGGACSKASDGANGSPGRRGNPGAAGPKGSDGVITPAIITEAEWQEELTLPWLQTINPHQGPPGTAVTAVGLNIDAGDTVLVNGHNVPATSPASGQLHFSLPTTLRGGTATIAIRRASDGKESNAMNFSVQPLIRNSSAAGGYTPGDKITLNGAAFLPNASVHFTPSGQTEQVIVPQTIDANGTSLDFVVPPSTTATAEGQGTASVNVVNPDGLESNLLQITRLSFLANGFLPDPNGFAFVNFHPGTPDLGTFQEDFGSLEVDASFLTTPVLTGLYFAAYEYFLGSAVTGLCTGFSLSAMKRFLNGETRTVDEAAAPTPALTREFTVDMGRLLSGQLLSTFLSQCLNGLPQAESTLEQIEQTFTQGPTRGNMPVIFFIPAGLPVSKEWFNNLNASHCLVPYKLTRPAGWTSGYDGVKLYLYDCNDPKKNTCCLTFQQRGNTLAFSYSADSSVSSDNGWTLGVLTMDQALFNSVDLPWVYGAGAALEYVVDVILSPATLAISNQAGQTTGTRGNSIVAEVPGAIPSLQPMHELVMVPRQLALQRTIQGTGKGTYTYGSIAPPDPTAPPDAFNGLLPQGEDSARIVPGARSLTLQNVSCTPSTRDVVLLDANNYSIQVSTNETGKTFNALLAQQHQIQTGPAPDVKTTSKVQLVELKGLSMGPGEQLLLWSDATLGQVGVSNTGAAKDFHVTVSTVDPATGKVTATQNAAGSVAANADFAMAVPDWNQLSNALTTKQGALRELLPSNFQMPAVQ